MTLRERFAHRSAERDQQHSELLTRGRELLNEAIRLYLVKRQVWLGIDKLSTAGSIFDYMLGNPMHFTERELKKASKLLKRARDFAKDYGFELRSQAVFPPAPGQSPGIAGNAAAEGAGAAGWTELVRKDGARRR